MRGAQRGGQRIHRHRKAVVLAGDADAACVQVFHRVVGAVMAVGHLERLGTRGQGHDLVAQADAEGGHAAGDDLARGGDRVVARLGVAGAVGQEHAIWPHRQYLGGGSLRGHHGQLATAFGQHAQDVVLGAEVVRHHLEAGRVLAAIAFAQAPFGLRPGVGFGGADHLGQIQPAHGRRGARSGQDGVDGGLIGRLALGQRQDGAVLRALIAQQARELACVDAGNGHATSSLQVFAQAGVAAEVAGQQRQIAHDQAGGEHLGRLHVFAIGAVAADVGVSQGDQLLAVAGVGQDFLVAGDRGVEHHFADRLAGSTNGLTDEDRAIGKGQDGGGVFPAQGGKHGILRWLTVAHTCLATQRAAWLVSIECWT